jgi:hypothetical protein
MVVYNLEHLTQDPTEKVLGPIQDTEALFLYSVVRGMRMRRVLEIGGLSGYSARNFLQAFAKPAESIMYTVDVDPVPQLAPNHCVLLKDARHVTMEDLHGLPLDHAFSLHTPNESHDETMPFRHGVTVMQRFVPLEV